MDVYSVAEAQSRWPALFSPPLNEWGRVGLCMRHVLCRACACLHCSDHLFIFSSLSPCLSLCVCVCLSLKYFFIWQSFWWEGGKPICLIFEIKKTHTEKSFSDSSISEIQIWFSYSGFLGVAWKHLDNAAQIHVSRQDEGSLWCWYSNSSYT